MLATTLLLLIVQDSPAQQPWSVSVDFIWRWMDGETKVRELASRPARLVLGSDLGVDLVLGLHAEGSRSESWGRMILEADYFMLWGDGKLNKNFQYDEGNFRANLPFNVSGRFFFARGLAEFKVCGSPESWFGAIAGLEYANIALEIDQPGVDSSSEGYKQFIPYPVLGLAYEARIANDLAFSIRATGAYVSYWATPFEEGGTMYMSVKTAMVEAAFYWRLSEILYFNFGAQYQYWDGFLHSHEDGNHLLITSPGLKAGLELRW
jgi:hypothetical protein